MSHEGSTAERDVPHRCTRCHGDLGWYGLHGAWEPCPDCDPPRPIPPEVTHCANCGAEVPIDKPHKVGECVFPPGTDDA